jgi:cell division protein FtsL
MIEGRFDDFIMIIAVIMILISVFVPNPNWRRAVQAKQRIDSLQTEIGRQQKIIDSLKIELKYYEKKEH